MSAPLSFNAGELADVLATALARHGVNEYARAGAVAALAAIDFLAEHDFVEVRGPRPRAVEGEA